MRLSNIPLVPLLLLCATASTAVTARYARLDRLTFNRLAAQHALPVFWSADANKNQTLDAAELAALWGTPGDAQRYLKDGAFTPEFAAAYDALVASAAAEKSAAKPADNESRRRDAVRRELDQGRPTLVAWDFTGHSAEDRAVVQHILAAARLVDGLFLKQLGASGMADQIPSDDSASRMLFWRNQGPWCQAPATEDDPACSALPNRPARVVDVYPADLQNDATFCAALEKHPNQAALLDPFVVVRKDAAGGLSAVPYTVAYKAEMTAISAELVAAAAALQSAEEAPFKAYLNAAAKAFLDNNWTPADQAWAAMNVLNSKWYLRVGPDEVYWEPCSRKAGFHVGFARINQGSLTWQRTLEPVKKEIEQHLATLAGPPYAARDVAFHLPDFIDIVVNAGDARAPMGATIGQSLPNWGPVAEAGGRTVAMVNFYTDPDSRAALRSQAESLLCKASMKHYTEEDGPGTMSTVLHEAAHNLGPSHDYRVDGKTDAEAMGGPLASMMEELKAQTSAQYLTGWLAEKKVITAAEARKAWLHDVVWAFGHISRGMYEKGKPKPYSQLSAVQMGFLNHEGVLKWNASQKAANGKDTGCFEVNMETFHAASTALEKQVLSIKARNAGPEAETLRATYVDKDEAWKALISTITQRWLRQPKSSFVYSVKF